MEEQKERRRKREKKREREKEREGERGWMKPGKRGTAGEAGRIEFAARGWTLRLELLLYVARLTVTLQDMKCFSLIHLCQSLSLPFHRIRTHCMSSFVLLLFLFSYWKKKRLKELFGHSLNHCYINYTLAKGTLALVLCLFFSASSGSHLTIAIHFALKLSLSLFLSFSLSYLSSFFSPVSLTRTQF